MAKKIRLYNAIPNSQNKTTNTNQTKHKIMPKSIPTIGDSNWGVTLNNHLSQLQSSTTGGINTFEQFSSRPTNLTADDAGKTYLYTQTGNIHQWTGTTWKVLNESVINVKDYGAVGDGIGDDTAAIQFCLDIVSNSGIYYNFKTRSVYLPNGVYITTKPLLIPEFDMTIFGESIRTTLIKKITNTKDSLYDIDAVLILKKNSGNYNEWANIHDLAITSTVNCEYGIFANGAAYLKLTSLNITYVKTGFSSNDGFLLTFNHIMIAFVDIGIRITVGTSLNASIVSIGWCRIGFQLQNLHYSNLTTCTVDQLSGTSYELRNCHGLTLNSCSTEASGRSITNTTVQPTSIISAELSEVTVNGLTVLFNESPFSKAMCYAFAESKIILNNTYLRGMDPGSKFALSESGSSITIDNITNMSLLANANGELAKVSYSIKDKFIEVGGTINTPNKQLIVNSNSNYQNTIKSVIYDANYPAGNNNYNENLNLNLEAEITNLVGSNWAKASITFQGNDGTVNTGYVLIQAFQTSGFKSFVLISANGNATLVGNTLKIPTITGANGGYWYGMKGIYEITISV
jgi:Pectate lyase superfamily protein